MLEENNSGPVQAGGNTPRVWALLGDKLGDNAQVEVIMDALGWPVETRRLVFKPEYRLGKPKFKPSLYHLDRQQSDALEAPWPDLILTIGRRPSMAAQWVRAQSGGRSRVVIIGRPKRMLDEFALVIATPQYQMPDHPKVLRLELPLMRPDTDTVAAAVSAWRERLAPMPRPLTAVLVGGITKPFKLDADTVQDLAGRAAEAAGRGSLYLTTSRRTPPEVVRHLEGALPRGSRSFVWGRDPDQDNPYQALLGSADRFIVTGDSISMMIEVAAIRRPLAIYPLPETHGLGRGMQRVVAGSRAFKWAQQHGLVGFSRDLTAIHRLLYRRGLAVPLGEPFLQPAVDAVPEEVQRVVARIRSLMD